VKRGHLNSAQISLDCAVVRQALSDLRAWNRPVPEKQPKNEPERLTEFKDAARWAFDGAGHAQWHFSLAAVCARLDLDVRKVRANMLARLTANQRAWMAVLGLENGQLAVKGAR
jgi:hypothetical protein